MTINNLTPSEYAEYLQIEYSKNTTNEHKKTNGQFFTSKIISDFMADLAQPKSDTISILDPGCGTGILSCSLIEKIINNNISNIELILYELDKNVIKETQKTVEFLKKWLIQKRISLEVKILNKDFILANSEIFFNNTLFANHKIKKFDYIISNPPYFKISIKDPRAKISEELVYGQPNIYSLFMGLSAKLLKPSGELIFITPRSFAAGHYFKAFRDSFFNDVHISNIHIFNSRNKMFKNDNVLQENIIIRANRNKHEEIDISVSECFEDLGLHNKNKYKTEHLIDLASKDKILFIPSNKKEFETINIFKKWTNLLNDYNIQISTGPVVAFRCKEYLVEDYSNNHDLYPLLWLHNVKKMDIQFPLQKDNKASYIKETEKSNKLLLDNKNYILIRRFSSKDDKSRLVCAPYLSANYNYKKIGIENHLNYIHRPNGKLTEDEVWGISVLFNSYLFDTYFRTFNGNTQVGATELKQIKMPPLNMIIQIGKKAKSLINISNEMIDNLVNEILLGKIDVKNIRGSRNLKKIGIA
ncbi:MAG: Eco57I restriction-modification methylase domain-containing protein [Spirochaetes bacterium]|nr:Eco57I restriction-modification methylase domain-containing protein [Spirochaetota bacterium]